MSFLSSDSLDLNVFTHPKLKEIGEKVANGERITESEGLFLFEYPDDEPVRLLADFCRQRSSQNDVYFSTTLYIHPTNLCELSCPMCSFYAKPGWKKAWFMTPKQIEDKVRSHLHKGLREVHIVGGLWRDCDLSYYKETFQRIKALDENLHIKALTPVEYDFIAEQNNMSIEDVFDEFKGFGLGSLPGGGAEILVEHIRKQVAPQKISSERFLEIHKIAHKKGISSNITMLFGHVEDYEHIITHLAKVRSVQDETNGFLTFVPLKYHVENNALGKRTQRLKPKNIKRVFSVSRLMLDNVPHLKALWNYLGPKEAQELLHYGADDFSATQIEEKVITMAGGTDIKMDRSSMEDLITQIGRTPCHAHSSDRLQKVASLV
jgi:aminodeoxyfutalosine synthase